MMKLPSLSFPGLYRTEMISGIPPFLSRNGIWLMSSRLMMAFKLAGFLELDGGGIVGRKHDVRADDPRLFRQHQFRQRAAVGPESFAFQYFQDEWIRGGLYGEILFESLIPLKRLEQTPRVFPDALFRRIGETAWEICVKFLPGLSSKTALPSEPFAPSPFLIVSCAGVFFSILRRRTVTDTDSRPGIIIGENSQKRAPPCPRLRPGGAVANPIDLESKKMIGAFGQLHTKRRESGIGKGEERPVVPKEESNHVHRAATGRSDGGIRLPGGR